MRHFHYYLLCAAVFVWNLSCLAEWLFFLKLLAVAIILFYAAAGADRLLRNKQFVSIDFLNGLLMIITGLTALGGTLYYIYALNDTVCIFFALLLLALAILGAKNIPESNLPKIKPSKKQVFLTAAFLVSIIACCILIFNAQTTDYLLSPWQSLSPAIFVFFLAGWGILFYLINKYPGKNILFIILYWAIFLCTAIVIYQLGYGYDPFVHQAAEKHIAEHGLILPKTLYYNGQYFLVVFLSKLTSLSVNFWDKHLFLALLILTLPTVLRRLTQKTFSRPESAALFFPLFPLAYFIGGTPFALATYFFLLSVFLPFEKNHYALAILSAAAALIIHPLPGLAAVIVLLNKISPRKHWLIGVQLIGGILLIPLAFTIFARLNSFEIIFNSPTDIIRAIKSSPWIYWQQKHFPWRDLLYQYLYNINFIFIALAVWGARILQRKNASWLFAATSGLALLGSWLIVKFGMVFNDLIIYERDDFGQRLLFLGLLAAAPLWLAAFDTLMKYWRENQRVMIKIFLFMVLLFAAGASFYATYPRHDDFENHAGFNTAQADFSAVKVIEQNAQGRNYAVLAPQTTSAAALATFGFSREIKPGVYFYPVPTSSPWYGYYLRMINERPQADNIQEAKNYAGADLLYLVIPPYWQNGAAIADAARQVGGHELIINEPISIFQF